MQTYGDISAIIKCGSHIPHARDGRYRRVDKPRDNTQAPSRGVRQTYRHDGGGDDRDSAKEIKMIRKIIILRLESVRSALLSFTVLIMRAAADRIVCWAIAATTLAAYSVATRQYMAF
jgi:hypothetical protein